MCPTDFPKGYAYSLKHSSKFHAKAIKEAEARTALSLGKWVGMARRLLLLFCQSGCWVLDLRNKAAVSLMKAQQTVRRFGGNTGQL